MLIQAFFDPTHGETRGRGVKWVDIPVKEKQKEQFS